MPPFELLLTPAGVQEPSIEPRKLMLKRTAKGMPVHAPRPQARLDREMDQVELQDFVEEEEESADPFRGEAPAARVEMKVVQREHDVRFHVDITAVEEDPVQKIDISLPGQLPTSFPASLMPS